jgi:hypothetical protein
MLDYAANAISYWTVEGIRAEFEKCSEEQPPADVLSRTFGVEGDEESYWLRVKTNLRAGRIRMIFLADEIPVELRRIVEFLNSQMDPAEVLAIEIKQYVGEGVRTMVPRVLGQTAHAEKKKSASPPRKEPWTEQTLLQNLRDSSHPGDAEVAERILEWARDTALVVEGGRGGKHASLNLRIQTDGGSLRPFALYESSRAANISIYLDNLGGASADPQSRSEVVRRINELGAEATVDSRYPGIPLENFHDPAKWKQLVSYLDWIVNSTDPHASLGSSYEERPDRYPLSRSRVHNPGHALRVREHLGTGSARRRRPSSPADDERRVRPFTEHRRNPASLAALRPLPVQAIAPRLSTQRR